MFGEDSQPCETGYRPKTYPALLMPMAQKSWKQPARTTGRPTGEVGSASLTKGPASRNPPNPPGPASSKFARNEERHAQRPRLKARIDPTLCGELEYVAPFGDLS